MVGPHRTCVGCRTRFPRAQLLRFVADERGHLALDARGLRAGRGVYCCPKVACLDRAASRAAFPRSLRRRLAPVKPEALCHRVLQSARKEATALAEAGLRDGRARAAGEPGETGHRVGGRRVEALDSGFDRRLGVLLEQSAHLEAELQGSQVEGRR